MADALRSGGADWSAAACGGGWYVGGNPAGEYWVPASAYEWALLVPCGEDANSGTAFGVRAGCELTAKRGECEAEVRRAAWYDERCECEGPWLWPWAWAWKVVEGEGGADRVGDEEVSMARRRGGRSCVWWLRYTMLYYTTSSAQVLSVSACAKDAPAAVADTVIFSIAPSGRRRRQVQRRPAESGEKSLCRAGTGVLKGIAASHL